MLRTAPAEPWQHLKSLSSDKIRLTATAAHVRLPFVLRLPRDPDRMDDLHFGVHESMMYALNTPPVQGAQWTGIVTQIAIAMLESGAVEAVVCVQSDPDDRFTPRPVSSIPFLLFMVGGLWWSGCASSRRKCCVNF